MHEIRSKKDFNMQIANLIAVVNGYSPWNAIAVVLNMLQELLSLAFFSDVDLAVVLVFWKLFEAVCRRHSFKAGEFVSSWSMSRVLRNGVDVDFKVAWNIMLFLGPIVCQ